MSTNHWWYHGLEQSQRYTIPNEMIYSSFYLSTFGTNSIYLNTGRKYFYQYALMSAAL